MKVFISWSGERSKAVAELIEEWLKCVIQAVEPWLSSKSIDQGAHWSFEIANQLASTDSGIICLTHENKEKPWILFEAGALAKSLTNKGVWTLLVDLKDSDVENPLGQFQLTSPDKEGIYSLIKSINSRLTTPLQNEVLGRVFETHWPQFEEDFTKIIEDYPATGPVEHRSDGDILSEILTAVRGFDKRLREIEMNRLAGEIFSGATGPSGPPSNFDSLPPAFKNALVRRYRSARNRSSHENSDPFDIFREVFADCAPTPNLTPTPSSDPENEGDE